jgi:hypothetical protein
VSTERGRESEADFEAISRIVARIVSTAHVSTRGAKAPEGGERSRPHDREHPKFTLKV